MRYIPGRFASYTSLKKTHVSQNSIPVTIYRIVSREPTKMGFLKEILHLENLVMELP